MNCKELNPLLTRYLLGDLEPEQAESVKTHLESCAVCREEANLLQPTLALLSDALKKPATAQTHLEFSRRNRVLVARPGNRLLGWATASHPKLAAAAGIMIVFGLIVSLIIPSFSLRTERRSAVCNENILLSCLEPSEIVLEDARESPIRGRRFKSEISRKYAGFTASPEPVDALEDIDGDEIAAAELTPCEDIDISFVDADIDQQLNAARASAVTPPPPPIIPTPDTTVQVQPADFDSVASVKSPMIMFGTYGSRSPGRQEDNNGDKGTKRQSGAQNGWEATIDEESRIAQYEKAERLHRISEEDIIAVEKKMARSAPGCKISAVGGKIAEAPQKESEAPILGDIPLAGRLFKAKDQKQQINAKKASSSGEELRKNMPHNGPWGFVVSDKPSQSIQRLEELTLKPKSSGDFLGSKQPRTRNRLEALASKHKSSANFMGFKESDSFKDSRIQELSIKSSGSGDFMAMEGCGDLGGIEDSSPAFISMGGSEAEEKSADKKPAAWHIDEALECRRAVATKEDTPDPWGDTGYDGDGKNRITVKTIAGSGTIKARVFLRSEAELPSDIVWAEVESLEKSDSFAESSKADKSKSKLLKKEHRLMAPERVKGMLSASDNSRKVDSDFMGMEGGDDLLAEPVTEADLAEAKENIRKSEDQLANFQRLHDIARVEARGSMDTRYAMALMNRRNQVKNEIDEVNKEMAIYEKFVTDNRDSREEAIRRLNETLIPEIDFRQADLKDIVAFLQNQSAEFSEDGDTPLKISLRQDCATKAPDPWGDDDSASGDTPITFSANDITLKETLDIVADISNMKYIINDDGSIKLQPKNAACSEIEHRMYDISPATAKRLADIAKRYDTNSPNQPPNGLKEFFAEMGVEWPNDSSVKYVKGLGKIVVVNTTDNIETFQKVIDSISTPEEPDEEDPKRRSSPRDKAIQKLEETHIPEVDFRQAKLKDVVAFLQSQSVKFNTGDKPPVQISLNLDSATTEEETAPDPWGDTDYTPGNANTPITFCSLDITLKEAVDIITDISNLKYLIDDNGKLTILPKNAAVFTEIKHREFDISPVAAKRLADIAKRYEAGSPNPTPKGLAVAFADLGIEWPSGSSVRYSRGFGKLDVANTVENFDKFQKVLKKLSVPEEPEEDADGKPRAKAYGVNPFVETVKQAFSTFAIDVDTAAYTLGRNYLLRGELPPAESVRTEEYVNFFDYGYQAPLHKTFAVYTEVAPSKFGHGLHLLKIGVKGRRLGREEQRRAVLTFLIDTSGSMNRSDRLGLVQHSLELLVNELNPDDLVAIVQYDSHARLLLEHTPASKKSTIMKAIKRLQCGGSTNLEEGMQRAYELAAANFVPKGENRVLLLSDGVANLGSGSADDILKKIEAYRDQGITCSVFGFGMGSYDDTMLETLANKGNGAYAFIDSEQQAQRVFVDDLSATLNTIAADVKIQVEYNPAFVARYRQLGYENRQLKKEDFRNDSIDAGEVGSGQSVTALYELDMNVPQQSDFSAGCPPVRDIDTIATIRVRYRRTDTGAIEEIEHLVKQKDICRSFDAADKHFRLAAAVAEFAEILRGSPFAENSKLKDTAKVLRPIALELNLNRDVSELLRLMTTN